MPISEYFAGNGERVMSNLQREYGPTKGKSVFYALAQKRNAKPADEEKKPKYNIKALGAH